MEAITIFMGDVDEYAQGQFTTEASSVGIKPGEWPAFVLSDVYKPEGAIKRFDKLEIDTHDDEIVCVVYVEKSTGALIKILND